MEKIGLQFGLFHLLLFVDLLGVLSPAAFEAWISGARTGRYY